MTWGQDDYPGSSAPEHGGFDQYGYAWRQCTSFAMHRAVDDLRVGPFHWGNGGQWGASARAQGRNVSGTPAPHDLFSIPPYALGTGQFGHCGAVLQVDAARGQFLAEDYNWKPLSYEQHWLPVAGVDFINLGGAVQVGNVGSGGGTVTPESHPMDPMFAAQMIVALVFGRGMDPSTYNAIAADVQSLGQLQALYKWADAAQKNGEITLLDRVQNLRTDFHHTPQHTHSKQQITG